VKRRVLNKFKYIRQVFVEFNADNILKYSASLAYYTVFSMAPLIIVIISVCGLWFGRDAIEGHVYGQISDLVGKTAAIQIQDAIKNIHLTGNNVFATVVSIIVLIIGATGIFNEIQDSLNKIWGLRIKARKIWWKLILNRLLSFSLILIIGFMLVVSLLLNAIISAFGEYISRYYVNFDLVFLKFSDAAITFLTTSILFSLIFKILPDARIRWKDVIYGGAVTALFFTLGRIAIGFYLGRSNIASVYGAAGSIMIIMVWIYYSSIILYFGAEFTKVHAKLFGGKIYPNDYAVWIKTDEVPVANPVLKKKVLE
jgi:membrane protein